MLFSDTFYTFMLKFNTTLEEVTIYANDLFLFVKSDETPYFTGL